MPKNETTTAAKTTAETQAKTNKKTAKVMAEKTKSTEERRRKQNLLTAFELFWVCYRVTLLRERKTSTTTKPMRALGRVPLGPKFVGSRPLAPKEPKWYPATIWGYKVSQTPKLTKPDRAAPAAKRAQNPCGLQQSSISVCGQLQLEQGRESLVK